MLRARPEVPPLLARRAFGAGVLGLALAASGTRHAMADVVAVPVPLQIKLLAKVAAYDKNLAERAAGKVRVLVVAKPGDPDAARVAGLAKTALGELSEIGGLPVEALATSNISPPELRLAVEKQKVSVIYFAPGLSPSEVEAVGKALDGASILTASASPGDVGRGIVLGFDLVSSKPKILVHLAQAKKQRVALAADVLKLAKVIE